MWSFILENKDWLFSGGGVLIISGLVGWCRWLYARLNKEITFSPASALAIGYVNNFVKMVLPEIMQGRPCMFSRADKAAEWEVDISLSDKKLYLYIPRDLPNSLHQPKEKLDSALAIDDWEVLNVRLPMQNKRDFSFYAMQHKTRPDKYLLFDYPTAMSNLIEVLNYHFGPEALIQDEQAREKVEHREMGLFINAVRKLVRDTGNADRVVVFRDIQELSLDKR